jgi:ankyrin repeat protein
MFTACQRGHVDQFQHIIETKPSLEIYLNTTSNFSVSGITMSLTPLQTASCCGHEELASYILTFPNVLPNQQDPTYGMTALHLAIFLQQRFVVETLCRDGRTDPNQTNCEGKSCLQMAVERSNIAAVETLFRLKPNLPLDTKDLNGNTLLHAACVYPNQQLLKLLLFHTESVNESFIAGQNENRTKENISLIKLWRKATFHVRINND